MHIYLSSRQCPGTESLIDLYYLIFRSLLPKKAGSPDRTDTYPFSSLGEILAIAGFENRRMR